MTDKPEAEDWNYPGLNRFATTMERWFYHEQHVAYANAVLPDGTWRLFLGMLVYGAYVDRFLRVCLPSLLAPGNVPALDEPTIVIHTDRASVDRIVAEVEKDLTRHAKVEVHIVPDAILDMVPENPANKYWLLGATHNLHMQQAKYRCHGYHMLMPDHVYADGYFANLVRLKDEGARAIVQGGLSAKLEAVAPVIEAQGGVIGPADLVGLAIENMHPQLDAFIINGRLDLPGSLLLIMIGDRAVHIVSPHMSIVYLAHDVLMRAPLRLFNTIDGQLPWFIPADVEPTVPSPSDGMVYVEVSDKDKPGPLDRRGLHRRGVLRSLLGPPVLRPRVRAVLRPEHGPADPRRLPIARHAHGGRRDLRAQAQHPKRRHGKPRDDLRDAAGAAAHRPDRMGGQQQVAA
jgi:hypothetical protein